MTTINEQVMRLIAAGVTQKETARRCGVGRYRVRQIIAAERGEVLRAVPMRSAERKAKFVEDCLVNRINDASWIVAKAYGVSSSYVRMTRCGSTLANVRPDLPRASEHRKAEAEDHPYCIGCVHWDPESQHRQRPCDLDFPEAGTVDAVGCAAYFKRMVAATG
jgi:hypothetical protein